MNAGSPALRRRQKGARAPAAGISRHARLGVQRSKSRPMMKNAAAVTTVIPVNGARIRLKIPRVYISWAMIRDSFRRVPCSLFELA